jgi:sigma-B regulation protein RsbU (phosphoserine phosphatase)
MANANTLVYEGSTTNRYATFFYAQYNAETRDLNYVNAGHNPPLIFRKGSDVKRLDTGGPVGGLLPSFPYQQATIRLEPGDLLVAFTDGTNEAMNGKDEEWGRRTSFRMCPHVQRASCA